MERYAQYRQQNGGDWDWDRVLKMDASGQHIQSSHVPLYILMDYPGDDNAYRQYRQLPMIEAQKAGVNFQQLWYSHTAEVQRKALEAIQNATGHRHRDNVWILMLVQKCWNSRKYKNRKSSKSKGEVGEPPSQSRNPVHSASLNLSPHEITFGQIQTDPRYPFSNSSQKQEQDGEQSLAPHSYLAPVGSYSSQDELNFFGMQSQEQALLDPVYTDSHGALTMPEERPVTIDKQVHSHSLSAFDTISYSMQPQVQSFESSGQNPYTELGMQPPGLQSSLPFQATSQNGPLRHIERKAPALLQAFAKLGQRKKKLEESMSEYIERQRSKNELFLTLGFITVEIIMLAILNGLDQLESYTDIVNNLQARVGSKTNPLGIDEFTNSLLVEEWRHRQGR